MRLIAASLLLSALATPALAQDTDKPFEGASVTAITGVDVGSQIGDAKAGFMYGGQVGYDLQRGRTVFGVEGELTDATTKKCYNSPSFGSCGSASRDLYVGGRIGRVVGTSTLIYAKAGYTNARSEYTYYDATTTPTTLGSGSGKSDGIRGGVGVEQKVGKNVALKAEYRYSNYEGTYSRNQGVVGLGFRF